MARNPAKTILRILLWSIGVVIAILLLVALVVQLPPVQRALTQQLASMLSDQLNTEVGIGHIGLQFPKAVSMDEVYINTPDGDSLVRVGHLAVDIQLLELIQGKVIIQRIDLSDVYANVVTTDSTSNIAFLLDAFVTTDTTTNQPKAAPADSTAGAWEISLPNATVNLERIDVYYQDDPTGILLDLNVGTFKGQTGEVNLASGRIALQELALADSDIVLKLGPAPPDTTAAPLDYYLTCDRLTIERSRYRMGMDSLEVDTYIGSTALSDAALSLQGEAIVFTAPAFTLSEGKLQVDMEAPRLTKGLDYNHLQWSDIEIDLNDIRYANDSVLLTINQLTGQEQSGLALRQTQGRVVYAPDYLSLSDFLLRTDGTQLASEQATVRYNFATAPPLETLVADLQLNGHLGINDMLLLAPQLAVYPLLADNRGRRFDVRARAAGSGQALTIGNLVVDGPGIQLATSGTARYPFDPNRLAVDFTIDKLVAQPRALLPMLPASAIPAGIEWPERLLASGRVKYAGERLEMRLYASEQRRNVPFQSRVRVAGTINGPQQYPNTSFDLTIDTLLLTRRTLFAYLPPGTIPEEYRIPDYVRGSGTVRGKVDDLDLNISLDLPGGGTFARVSGNVKNATQPDQLRLDLALSDISVAAMDVSAILPDSLLPDYLQLPDLRVRNARISGGMNDLTFDMPIESSNGTWDIKGRYNPNDIDATIRVQGVRATELFKGPLRDTIATLNLAPLNVYAKVQGRIEPTVDARLTAEIVEQGKGTIVEVMGTAVGDNYAGNFNFSHPDLLGQGEASYALIDSVGHVQATLNLERIDLERWALTPKTLTLGGKLRLRSVGTTTDNLSAYLLLDDLVLRTDTANFYVDSLLATAELHRRQNDIQVRSDLLELSITGDFIPEKVFPELSLFIQHYWREEIPEFDPVVNGNRLDIDLRIKRPRALTSGIIPGLNDLSPATVQVVYRDNSPGLLIDINLPRLDYAGIRMDSLVFNAAGDTVGLKYQADWSEINLYDQVILGKTRFVGYSNEEALGNDFYVWDATGREQHHLAFVIDTEGDSTWLRMASNQLLNYDQWQVPQNNRVLLVDDQVMIKNWSLTHENQRLAIRTTDPSDVEVAFTDFELATVSRLLRSEEELVGGEVNGLLELDNVMADLEFRSNLKVDSLSVLESPLGQLLLEVASPNGRTFTVDAALKGEGNDASVGGTYDQNGSMNLTLDARRLPLRTAEPFSLGYLQDTEGYLTGQTKLGGTFENPLLNGELLFREAVVGVSILGARFRIAEDQPVILRNERIIFDNFAIYDAQNNAANLDGTITLRSFADYFFDLNMRARNFLVIDSDKEDNDLYYGRLVVDADVDITGSLVSPTVEVTASPRSDSRLVYLYSVSNLLSEQNGEGIVSFYDQLDWERQIRQREEDGTSSEVAPGYTIILNLNVNPELEFTLVLNPATKDQFVGSGTGDIAFVQYPDGSMEMTGLIEMTSGTYDYSYQGILSREFTVEPGSTVAWTGEVMNPLLDLRIRHRVRTSPYGLVENYVTTNLPTGLRQRAFFDVMLNLDGRLEEMRIGTDVRYPDIFGNDQGGAVYTAIDQSLTALRTDESQLNQQAFGLLLTQRFVFSGSTADDQTGIDRTINSTVDNVITNQLNNLANRYLSFVNINLGVESYADASGQTQRDVRLSLSKSFLNDRLVVSVDGVTSTDNNDNSGGAQTYLDNVTAEYLLDERGNLRLRIFNDRDRTQFALGTDVIRVGGRLVFSKDFDNVRFFANRDKKNRSE